MSKFYEEDTSNKSHLTEDFIPSGEARSFAELYGNSDLGDTSSLIPANIRAMFESVYANANGKEHIR